jgi:hypothetical protein
VTLLVLYFLASLDGLLCGCRTSMGRCPLIRTRPYYMRALVQGLLAAQVASLLGLLSLFLVLRFSSHRIELRADLESSAGRMLWIFLPYAAIVLLSLSLRLVPSTDLRSATSVFALGPLTAVRPIMMVGVLAGIYSSLFWQTRILGVIVLLLMLSIEVVLNYFAARKQAAEILEHLQDE